MSNKVIKNKVVKDSEVKKPYVFSSYKSNTKNMEGFDPMDYAKTYHEGQYELGSSLRDEVDMFLPLKIKKEWFKEIYPNGFYTFSDFYTLPGKEKKSSTVIFVNAMVWKEKPEVVNLDEHTYDYIGVGSIDLEYEETDIKLIHTRALSNALSSMGFDLPISERDLRKEEIFDGNLDTNTIKEVESEEEEQMETSNKEDTEKSAGKSSKKAKGTGKASKKVVKKNEDSTNDVADESEDTQLKAPKITLFEVPEEAPAKEVEVVKDDDLKPESILKEVDNNQLSFAIPDEKHKTYDKPKEEVLSDAIDRVESRETITEKQDRISATIKAFKPSQEEALKRVIRYKNEKGLTLEELLKDDNYQKTAQFITSTQTFIHILSEIEDEETLNEYIKDAQAINAVL